MKSSPNKGPRPNRGAVGTSSLAGASPLSKAIADDALMEPDHSSILEILSMNEARDTCKWDSIAKGVKRRVVRPRRDGLAIPSYSSSDEEDYPRVAEPERPLTADERIRQKLEAQAKLDHVASYTPLTTAAMTPFGKLDIQSNFCFKCWMLVSAPPVGLSCFYCPVIAHRHCVEIIQVQAKAKLRRMRRKFGDADEPDDDDIFHSSDEDSEDTSRQFVTAQTAVDNVTAEELNMKWVCPFCIETLHCHNDFKEQKVDTALRIIEERRRSTTVAATAKMFMARKRWIARVKNSIKIQRFIRQRTTMQHLREELRATKSVVRVVLQEVQLQLIVPGVEHNPEEYDLFRNIGQFGSIMLDKYLKTSPPNKPDLKTAIEIFRAGMATPALHLRPMEKAVSSNSLVLTVTVHDMLDGDKQIYRLDTPLLETSKKRKAHVRGDAQSDDDRSVNSMLDDLSLRSGSSEQQRIKMGQKQLYYRPQLRGVMVFPACHADVLLRFTVSEVSKWPNSVAIARAEMVITDYILKRQSVVLSQRLEAVSRVDKVIEPALFSRLAIANFRNSRAEPSRFVMGHGRLTWGVITATGSSTMAGPLLLLPDVDSWGAKKRTWCALMDKTLYIYSSTADVLAKEQIDLTNCKVMMHENEVGDQPYLQLLLLSKIHVLL